MYFVSEKRALVYYIFMLVNIDIVFKNKYNASFVL